MNKTKIEQLEFSWNPIAMRCTPVSEGCANCWHLRTANRLACNPQFTDEVRAAYAGEGPPVLVPSRLEDPLKRKKPSMIGVQWMGDLFHEDIPEQFIYQIFDVATKINHHTFQFLTKRPVRMEEVTKDYCLHREIRQMPDNVWGLVTTENQETADYRIPILLQCPFRTLGVSIEPMLGSIKLNPYKWLPCNYYKHGSCVEQLQGAAFKSYGPPRLDWVVVGGESGSGARPMDPDWVRSLRDQCKESGVPFFFKQGSAANWDNYKDFGSFPPDLQIRQYPYSHSPS